MIIIIIISFIIIKNLFMINVNIKKKKQSISIYI